MSTSTSEAGEVYGAEALPGLPFGGGPTYDRIVTAGDATVTVTSVGDLIACLPDLSPGSCVFIPGSACLDFTANHYGDKLPPLVVPAGVTVASDRGHDGSPGALLVSDDVSLSAFFETGGDGCRFTGFRLRGPARGEYFEHWRRTTGGGAPGYYALPTLRGIVCGHSTTVIDNLLLSEFSHAGILVASGDCNISASHIAGCRRKGLGYGITVRQASAIIHRNIFGENRHSIASTGEPGSSYRVRNNLFVAQGSSHTVDVHKDASTSAAGDSIDVQSNCFSHPAAHPAVYLRALPTGLCLVRRNWFQNYHASGVKAVRVNTIARVDDNKVGL